MQIDSFTHKDISFGSLACILLTCTGLQDICNEVCEEAQLHTHWALESLATCFGSPENELAKVPSFG